MGKKKKARLCLAVPGCASNPKLFSRAHTIIIALLLEAGYLIYGR